MGGAGGMPSAGQMQEMQQKQEQQESMRKDLLQKILTPEAQERLARISLVKSDKARKLEDMVLMMAQKGQVQSQITDDRLKHMLEGISDSGEEAKPKIVLNTRRHAMDDSDSDIDLDGL